MTKRNRYLVIGGAAALLLLGGGAALYFSKGEEEPKFPPGSEQAVEAVKIDMAEKAGVAVAEVKILSVVQRDWPDSCLGLVEPGKACARVITPGYEVEAEVKEQSQRFVYRTNADGTVLVRSVAAYL